MKKIMMGIIFLAAVPVVFGQGLVADHEYDFNAVTSDLIDRVKTQVKLHIARTSHGGQITGGLERLAELDPRLQATRKWKELPQGPGLCFMDGQFDLYYATPEQYWKDGGDLLTRQSLAAYPSLNVSMFVWCRELDSYSESDVQGYLARLTELEADFPNVVFVHVTGNAQAKGPGAVRRYRNNRLIRDFCRDNNRVLFDFADLDAWYQDEQHLYTYEGQQVPREHPRYNGDECGHATFESCENKARALWWLLARIVDERMPESCDANGDGLNDDRDLAAKQSQLQAEFLTWDRDCWSVGLPCADFNGDGIVDDADRTAKDESLRNRLTAWMQACGLRKKGFVRR